MSHQDLNTEERNVWLIYLGAAAFYVVWVAFHVATNTPLPLPPHP